MASKKSSLPRVDHLRRQHAKELDLLADGDRMPFGIARRKNGLFDYALAIDPTPKALYLSTVIRWFLTHAIRFEDARQVRTILARFHADKHRLPVAQRDIGRYSSPGDIVEIMVPMDEIALGDVPAEVMADCTTLDSGEGWALIKVSTAAAARWWADSTEWCTRHAHHAENYLRTGPLYILTSGRTKYQFHLSTSQFMDRLDRPVEAMPEMPVEAIEAALRVANGTIVPGVEFYRPGVAQALDAILHGHGRDMRRRVPRNGENWVRIDTADGVTNEGPDWGFFGDHEHSVQNREKWIEVYRAGNSGRLKANALRPTAGISDVHVDILMAFLRSGAARASNGSMADGCHMIERDGELAFVAQQFFKGVEHARLVVCNGRRYGVWVGRKDGVFSGLIVVDIDEPSRDRLCMLGCKQDFETAPEHMKAALCLFADDCAFDIVLTLGAGMVREEALLRWRSAEVRSVVLDMIVQADADRQFDVAGVVELMFPPSEAVAMIAEAHLKGNFKDVVVEATATDSVKRLLSGIRTADGMIHRVESRTPPTAEDLLSCIEIENAGILMAALPDVLCTEALVDTMIAAGRGEVLHVMPAHLFTVERVELAMKKVRSTIKAVSPRIVSWSARKALFDASDFSMHLLGLIDSFLIHKGSSIVGEALNGRFERMDDVRRRELAAFLATQDLDGFYIVRNRFPDVNAKILQAFEGITPAGLPWPYAMDAIVRNPQLVHDVLPGVERGEWGDPSRCMHQLRTLRGVREILDADLPRKPSPLKRALRLVDRILPDCSRAV